MSDGPLVDPKAQKEKRKKERLARLTRDEDFKHVLASPQGRRFVWRLIEETGTFSGSFVPGDALSSAYAEGRRATGRELMTEAQRVSRAGYLVMVGEQMKELPQQTHEAEDTE